MTPKRRRRASSLAGLAGVLSAILAAGPAGGATASAEEDHGAERALAERFAPVVRLVHQGEECGPGEPFQPSDVELVLDDPSVALRAPWANGQVTKSGPTAEDLSLGLYGYYLDYPGNALEPGCDYERWAGAEVAGRPTIYAHVVGEAGRDDRLALQYWFFYPYNDYTNKHEGDWEMVQLVFAAADASEALEQMPTQLGYSQHEGLEVSDWDDAKLELVDGTHPVVYPAAGSHANFYEDALYLGTSAQQGFGCDDTRSPDDDLRPTVAVIPGDPETAVAVYPWIGFRGRWGQQEQAFYNGPTGPNTKTSWTRPISYMEEKGRDVSYAVPAAGALGTGATDFFCNIVSSGSEVVRKLADHPWRLLLILALLALLPVALLRRTSWSPVVPLRIARRRSGGQLIRAAWRIYLSRWRLFIGIGLVTIPMSILVATLQGVLLGGEEVGGLSAGGQEGGARVILAAVLGLFLIAATILLVLTASTHALDRIDRGLPVGVRRAYRSALASWRATLGAFLVTSVVVGLLALSAVLSLFAVVVMLLAALFVPVIVFEQAPAIASLRRSAQLVGHQVLKTAVLLAVSILVAGAVGPLLGTMLILVTGAPFPLANVVSGVTYAVLMPYVALTMAYLYFDARIRTDLDLEHAHESTTLPAELPR